GLASRKLSEYIWWKRLHTGLPKYLSVRDVFGFLIILGYFLLIPPILAKKLFKGFYQTLGPIRFHVMTFLLLCMTALPIKMVLRWLFNLKYIIGIPEYFFNI